MEGKVLEKLSVHSVADALRYFSGVQIKDYGGIGGLKTVNIRAMGTQHVGVFYDGIELGNAQNGTVDLGRFSLDNMENAFWTLLSLSGSAKAVASSKIMIGEFFSITRAIAILCCSPPDK